MAVVVLELNLLNSFVFNAKKKICKEKKKLCSLKTVKIKPPTLKS